MGLERPRIEGLEEQEVGLLAKAEIRKEAQKRAKERIPGRPLVFLDIEAIFFE